MNIISIQNHFSFPRINRYLIAASNNNERAVKLYKHNLKISQSFLPILSVFEVILRNRLSDKLSEFFADSDWITTQTNGFMSDPTLSYHDRKKNQIVHNHFLKSSVSKSIHNFNKKNIPISSGKIIADQHFSFWTELFELTYYKILLGRPIQIFEHLPSGIARVDVLNRLTTIRKFRNRISHHEPICFSGNTIDFSECKAVYNSIKELLSWIDPYLINFISDIDHVDLKIRSACQI